MLHWNKNNLYSKDVSARPLTDAPLLWKLFFANSFFLFFLSTPLISLPLSPSSFLPSSLTEIQISLSCVPRSCWGGVEKAGGCANSGLMPLCCQALDLAPAALSTRVQERFQRVVWKKLGVSFCWLCHCVISCLPKTTTYWPAPLPPLLIRYITQEMH